MDSNICNICGANYIHKNGKWICPACDNIKIEKITNEEVVLLTNAATSLRMANFDVAEELFNDMIKKYPNNASGYWGLVLSKYGIKYEEDSDGKMIPTVYATSMKSFLSDPDYLNALKYADKELLKFYKEQAHKIEAIRIEWIDKASKEPPYDVFICFKDSDLERNIERTDDSYEAQNLYTHLTQKGYNVFFSRESLRDKISEKFEPYIFNALNTAHVMIVYGSSKEYLESTWVKNEWSRFLKRIKNGDKQENSIILAYEKMNASDLPKEFSKIQCLDASKRTFYQDLDSHIDKIVMAAKRPKSQIERVEIGKKLKAKHKKIHDNDVKLREIGSFQVTQLAANQQTNIKNGYKFLSKGLFEDATNLFKIVLEKDKTNGDALLGQFLSISNVRQMQELQLFNITNYQDLELIISYLDKSNATALLSRLIDIILLEFEKDNVEGCVDLIDFVLQYKFDRSKSLINDLEKYCIFLLDKKRDAQSDILADIIIKYLTQDTEKYLSFLKEYIESLRKHSFFGLAEKYIARYEEYFEGDIVILWEKLCNNLKCSDEKELSSKIVLLKDFSLIEKLLKYSDGKERNEIIKRLLSVLNDSISNNSLEKHFKSIEAIVDRLLQYTQKEEFNYFYDIVFEIATNFKMRYQFDIAEKYFSLIVGEMPEDSSSYWGILQSKLQSRNNDELIKQPTSISSIPEFNSAIIAAGDDERLSDKYIDVKAKQLEYQEKQKQKEQRNKKVKRVFTIMASMICVILCSFIAFSYYLQYRTSQSNLVYTYNSSLQGYVVTCGRYYNPENVIIPETYMDKNVVAVKENGFKNKTSLVNLFLPKTIIEIGDNAFSGCINLSSVVFNNRGDSLNFAPTDSSQEGIKRIGCYAFNNTHLTKVNIPNSVNEIGEYAFSNCHYLNEFNLSENLTRIEKGLFENSFTKTNATITIPNNITYVGENAFNGCTKLTDIFVAERNTVPDNWDSNWKGNSNAINVEWAMTIIYDYQGATNNKDKSKTSVILGKNFDWAVPTKLGYTFDGWFSQENGGGKKFTGPDGRSIEVWSENSGETVYAKWTPNNNVLILNGNGHTSGHMDNLIIPTAQTKSITANTFVKDGYTFAGWSTTNIGSVEYLDEDVYTMGTNSSYILYAVWEANTNEIVFYGNGATGGNMQNQQIKSDIVASLQPNGYTKTAYTFIGWSTSSDGEVEYPERANYAMGTNSIYYLYAIWEATTYNITYYLNDGQAENIATYNVNTETFMLNNPVKAGYEFIGWTGSNGVHPQKELSIFQGSFGDKEFWAQYLANTNEIVFDGNGSTAGQMENQQLQTDTTAHLIYNEYQKDGYEFVGWSTTPNGEVEFANHSDYTMGPNSSYTLYAIWEIATYTITYELNNGINNIDNVYLYTIETDTFYLLEPTREYYTFDGWYRNSHYNGEQITQIPKGSYGNIELYAKWNENAHFIRTVNDLKNVSNDLTETYVLANDLDLSGSEWTPIGTSSPFKGIFDGQNYTISNFKIRIAQNYVGFFGYVKDATIKNIKLSNIEINYSTSSDLVYAGGLVGYAKSNTTIENCKISGSITVSTRKSYTGGIVGYLGDLSTMDYCTGSTAIQNSTSYSSTSGGTVGASYVGGVVGYANYAQLSCCYTDNWVTHKAYSGSAGGIIGHAESTSLSNCYSTKYSSASTSYSSVSSGGIIGSANYSNINMSYSSGDISAYSSKGGAKAGGILGGGTNTDIINCYSLGKISATSTLGGGTVQTYSYAGNLVAYRDNCSVNNCFYYKDQEITATQNSNLGSSSRLILGTKLSHESILQSIYTQWDNKIWELSMEQNPLLKEVNNYYKIIYVLNDGINNYNNEIVALNGETITLYPATRSGYTFIGWYNNPEFLGESITEFEINSNIKLYAKWQENVVYISSVEDFVGISNYLKKDKLYRYVLVNDIDFNNANIQPLDDYSLINTSSSFVGILDGNGYILSNINLICRTNTYIGLVNDNKGIIKDLTIYNIVIGLNSIPSGGYFGCIAGLNHGSIINCKVYGEIEVSNCNGSDYACCVGGITGSNYQIIEKCVSNIKMNIENVICYLGVGGIAGSNGGTITKSKSSGNITIGHNVPIKRRVSAGGLVGGLSGELTDSYSLVNIDVSIGSSSNINICAGGLIGFITSQDNITCNVLNCFAMGCVSLSVGGVNNSGYVGGLVGSLGNKSVTNCYVSSTQNINATGTVSKNDVGIATNKKNFKDRSFIQDVLNWDEDGLELCFGDPDDYLIVLNSNGGNIINNYKLVSYDSNYTLEIPTRPGYLFVGWFDGTGNSAVQYTNELGESLQNWDLTNNSLTLYAKWHKYTAISSFDELQLINNDLTTMTSTDIYYLTQDIDCDGAELSPIGSDTKHFIATFDGNGYKIYNYKQTNDFSFIPSNFGTIKNLTLSNFYIKYTLNSLTEKKAISALSISNVGTIENCLVDGSVSLYGVSDSVTDNIPCLMVNSNSGIIRNSVAKGCVNGETKASGFVAYNDANGQIFDCYVDAIITAGSMNTDVLLACGFVYRNAGLIKSCFAIGDVVASCASSYVSSYAKITASGFLGIDSLPSGITDYGQIINCFSNSSVKAYLPIDYYGGTNQKAFADVFCTSYTNDSPQNISHFYFGAEQEIQQIYRNTIVNASSHTYENRIMSTLDSNFYNVEFITDTLGFNASNNIWLFSENDYPKLFWED